MALPVNPVGYTKRWILEQARLPIAASWHGGWERWAQGQIALKTLSNNIQVLTEERIYAGTNDAVDLVFQTPQENQYLELKCFGTMSNQEVSAFVRTVVADYDQVHKPLKPGVQRGSMWVVAIAQKVFRNQLQSFQNDPKWGQFRFEEVVCPDANGRSFGTFDIWYYRL